VGELFTLGQEYAARRPSTVAVPDETVGCRGVGREPSQDGLLGAVSFVVRGISFRVPPVMSRPVSRPVFYPVSGHIARHVCRSDVGLHLVQ